MTTEHKPRQSDDLGALSPVYAATYNHLGIILWGPGAVKRHLANEIAWLERHPQFRIGWDHEAFTYDWLAENEPDTLEQMKDALQRFPGRLGVGSSTYGQPLSMFIDGESNLRQLALAMDTCEKRLGYTLSVYIMSEHPFHAQMPQLLVGCGFKGAILRTHFMMYGHNPTCEAPVVWWIGVDGSQILTVPTYPGQDATPPLHYHRIWGWTSTLDNRILTDAISERCSMTLADFRRQFGDRIRPLIATRADDPRAQESLIEAHEGDPDYRWILVEDILHLVPQPQVRLETQANNFKVRMPWGYCGSWMWRRCREAEVKALTAERLAAIAHALGNPAPEADVEQAWKNLCVAQHHDIQICGLERDAKTYLDASVAASDGATARALRAIAPRLGRAGDGKRTVVFNPLGWQRTEWVQTGQGGRIVTAPGLGFVAVRGDDASGQAAPAFSWQPEARCDLLRSQAWRQTASGHETYWEYEPVGQLITPFYDVYTAPTGGFRLVVERATGKRLLAPPKTSGTLAGLINGRDCESRGEVVDVKLEADRAVLVEKGEIGGIPYRIMWTFYRHTRRIDWGGELDFDNQWIGRPRTPVAGGSEEPGTEHRSHPATVTAWNDHEYKLRLRFYPYNGPWAVGIRDLPFHIAETSGPYVESIYWTAISDGQVGVALFNRGLMGSVHENDGALSSVLAFALPYVWGTRMLKGTYTYELGILPFTGPWRQAKLMRQALEYNFPFRVVEESALDNPLGDVWTPYQQTGHGEAILSALYTKNGRTYLRFWECEGQQAQVGGAWMGVSCSLTLADMREREQGRVGHRVTLGPWQVQTMRIEA